MSPFLFNSCCFYWRAILLSLSIIKLKRIECGSFSRSERKFIAWSNAQFVSGSFNAAVQLQFSLIQTSFIHAFMLFLLFHTGVLSFDRFLLFLQLFFYVLNFFKASFSILLFLTLINYFSFSFFHLFRQRWLFCCVFSLVIDLINLNYFLQGCDSLWSCLEISNFLFSQQLNHRSNHR